MSKKLGGGSWLTAVKRAFRSPSKEDDKKTSRRRLDTHEQDVDDEKKREKRRWLFRRGSSNNSIKQQQPLQYCEETNIFTKNDQQRHAIAVAAATTAAAEAAVATAKAAAEIIRLTKTKTPLKTPASMSLREHNAAIVVQTAFRGYLARRALQALRGIVKLQAIVRGHNVRKQTKTTLKYIHALRNVQARAARPSHEATRNSMFAESTNLWDSRYMKDVRARKSTQSRGGSWIPEDWEDCPRTLQELDALLHTRKNAALTRERSLAHAFSQQIWNYEKEPYADKKELEEGDNWLNEWMETKTKQCEDNKRRYSYDRRETIKTLEVDPLKKTYCYSSPLISKGYSPQPPITPSPAKMKPLNIRPSSPRAQREARVSYSTANTPSLSYVPNYMAATESAKAKVRSQSATRLRPSTPERERGGGGVRKRLSYPVHDMYCGYNGVGCEGCGQKLRSPSFKSVQAGYVGMEQRSNISSCCAESVVGGEISPCSTTDLRRWLR